MGLSLEARFEKYSDTIVNTLMHADREQPARWYIKGLMLPGERKSVEPMAARVQPQKVRSAHQSMHHLVAEAAWSDEAMLSAVAGAVLPKLVREDVPVHWIVDDTGFAKKGNHSVGVARQYCGQTGKQDNCRVAVSLSIATAFGSIPVGYRLYLPRAWTGDVARRRKVGVPEAVGFETKPALAMRQIEAALASGYPRGVVLADAAYGDETAWREQLAAHELTYAVGVRPGTTVWWGEHQPLTEPKPEGQRDRPRDEEWLIIEWAEGADEPAHYWCSNLPKNLPWQEMIDTVMGRWRIERDYEELKQELGLGHYEGRNWRGFHHHASLCIAAYGFLMLERLAGSKKNSVQLKAPTLPTGLRPRGAGTDAAT